VRGDVVAGLRGDVVALNTTMHNAVHNAVAAIFAELRQNQEAMRISRQICSS